ncbi:hypothetical protein M0805_006071, partial [Coniferiporia weirii]
MTTENTLPRGHIVAVAPPSWGHVKPLCALLAKVTNSEVARQFFLEGEEDLKSLIRVVGLPTPLSMADIELFKAAFFSSFFEGYKTLHAGKPIAAAPDGERVYDAVEAPQLVILD